MNKIWRRNWRLFNKSFSLRISSKIQERSIYEQQLVQSIHFQLLRKNDDNYNTYYLGNLNEFNQKTNEYMEKCQLYLNEKRIATKKFH